MKILSKSGNELLLLAMKGEESATKKGDYLLIEEDRSDVGVSSGRKKKEGERSMIVQVYDEEYLSSQSLTEDMVKEEVVNASSVENLHDPLNIASLSRLVRDARVFKAKIRAAVQDGRLTSDVTWLPSRVGSRIRRLKLAELGSLLGRTGVHPVPLGTSSDGEEFEIYAEDLDGRLTVVTGKKESGKSHLSKMLVKTLVQHGAFVIVFDLNNEYGGIAWNRDGTPSAIHRQVFMLEPGRQLRFSLEYCGKAAVSGMLKNALDMPAASLREFFRIWDWLENKGRGGDGKSSSGNNNGNSSNNNSGSGGSGAALGIGAIGNAINTWNINELVRDALVSRYHTIKSSCLFTDDGDGFRFEDVIAMPPSASASSSTSAEVTDLHPIATGAGAAMIIKMGEVSPTVRRMVVELVLSKVVDLLERKAIPPIFLFAEEAHLYIRETYWEDIITRMRHFGVYTTFVTNQPDAISDGIYRQVDNIFLFNFTNDTDLDKIARVSLADSDTVRSIVRTLPQRHCLAIGRAVCDLPIVVRVAAAEVLTLGETKKFFSRSSSNNNKKS